MLCQDRSGFLFAHDCDRDAVVACQSCGKQLCLLHQRPGAGGIDCVACSRAQVAETNPSTTTDDDPYSYASNHYRGYTSYDTRDRRAFDVKPSVEAETEVSDLDAS